jgi:hypothetical protein
LSAVMSAVAENPCKWDLQQTMIRDRIPLVPRFSETAHLQAFPMPEEGLEPPTRGL